MRLLRLFINADVNVLLEKDDVAELDCNLAMTELWLACNPH